MRAPVQFARLPSGDHFEYRLVIAELRPKVCPWLETVWQHPRGHVRPALPVCGTRRLAFRAQARYVCAACLASQEHPLDKSTWCIEGDLPSMQMVRSALWTQGSLCPNITDNDDVDERSMRGVFSGSRAGTKLVFCHPRSAIL